MSISWNGTDAPVPPGSSYGYARVSTTDRDLDRQYEALEGAGCRLIWAEEVSGTSVRSRDELRTLLDFIRPGDELVVTRVDRLARSMGDLRDIIRELKSKGAALRATKQPTDTSTPAEKAFLDMLGVFAEFESNLRRSAGWRGSRKRRLGASTGAGRRRSTSTRSAAYLRRVSGRAPSPDSSGSTGRAFGG